MIKTIEFSAFGVEYRTTQFPAIPAMELMSSKDNDPMKLLARTQVKVDGVWIDLNSRRAINDHVIDEAYAIPPGLVLNALLDLVGGYSFGFMKGWSANKVPKRFVSGSESVTPKYVDPTISVLFNEGLATMRELEEYYSLQDAFYMFDAFITKGINEALSHEFATRKSK